MTKKTTNVAPHSLKDAPALIERLLPVQKLSAEVFKERKAGAGQTLVPLGAYWKGRKPLILNRACILGCLLPATDDPKRDLEVFEMLMGMDEPSFALRWKRNIKPKEVLAEVAIPDIRDVFNIEPDVLPASSPIDWSNPDYTEVKVEWRENVSEAVRRRLISRVLPKMGYRERVEKSSRPEEVGDSLHDHIWEEVNAHLGTSAASIPELVEQLGIMRFGHRPRIGDTFCGSGQIPFEAARMGCDAYASDLNPIACMLTWGSFHIIGGSEEERKEAEKRQKRIAEKVLSEIDKLGIETDGTGWRAKAYLYCVEARCPNTGWMVPLLPSRVLSYGKRAIAVLIPDSEKKRYDIEVRSDVSTEDMANAEVGTVQSEGRGKDSFLVHTVEGREHRSRISTLRGDYKAEDGSRKSKLRLWEKRDFRPRDSDVFQERLYAVHWMKPKKKGSKQFDYEFRTVGHDDMSREKIVEDLIGENLEDWQRRGWIPDMQIEAGYNTDQPIRERGWTYWHHLFPPRHLLLLGLLRKYGDTPDTVIQFSRILDYTSKLCRWSTSKAGSSSAGEGGRTGGASDNPSNVFYNQALNTFFNYGCRASQPLMRLYTGAITPSELRGCGKVSSHPADEIGEENDIYVTDPPYGDAVNYEEILEFFIAWLRKSIPGKFAEWTWDSRRALAIKGAEEDFRTGMVGAYRRMSEKMSENGIQLMMFTHQDGSIWADMSNIVWAAGLQVCGAWYVVTETDAAIRSGSHVKGTVLLVLRKRAGNLRTTRDDLGWEIEDEVKEQVASLTGLNQEAKGLYRDENLFEDADLQMAGYAAALRVLTKYSVIDGKEMAAEAVRPRVKGQKTFVDDLIEFAVDTANQCLVPEGIDKGYWDDLNGAERFYLKMIDMEAKGAKALDNYGNFAKAFRVKDYQALMQSQKANQARLKSSKELGRTELSDTSELGRRPLRCVLYALMELQKNEDGTIVLQHLRELLPNFYESGMRERLVAIAEYLGGKLEGYRNEEASSARVLAQLLRNQKL